MNEKEYFQITTTLSKRGIVKNTPRSLKKIKDTLFLAKQKFYNSFVYDICTEEYKKLYENKERGYNYIDIEFYPLVMNKHNIDLLKTLGSLDQHSDCSKIFIDKNGYNVFGNIFTIYDENTRKILYSLNSE